MTGKIVVGALCYVVDNARRVLLLKRRNPPHVGLWSAPGGKMELGESPQMCAIREIREETGLTIHNPTLRGIVTTYHQHIATHWMLFIFRADTFTGELMQTDEGDLAWIPLATLTDYPMPYSDNIYAPRALGENDSLFQARFVYTSDTVCSEESFY